MTIRPVVPPTGSPPPAPVGNCDTKRSRSARARTIRLGQAPTRPLCSNVSSPTTLPSRTASVWLESAEGGVKVECPPPPWVTDEEPKEETYDAAH